MNKNTLENICNYDILTNSVVIEDIGTSISAISSLTDALYSLHKNPKNVDDIAYTINLILKKVMPEIDALANEDDTKCIAIKDVISTQEKDIKILQRRIEELEEQLEKSSRGNNE